MLNVRSITSILTAPAGSGKTYAIVSYLVAELLPHSQTLVYHNLPLNVDAIAEYVAPNDAEAQEQVKARLVPIPPEVLAQWNHARVSPMDWFFETDRDGNRKRRMDDSLILLDEAQYYIGNGIACPDSRTVKQYLASWTAFLSELRHDGSQIWFVTQTLKNLDRDLSDQAAVRIFVVDREQEYDPLFKVPMHDWLELAAGVTGKYVSWVKLIVKRNTDGKWDVIDERQYVRKPSMFALYDSFSARHGQEQGSGGPRHEYLKRSLPGLVLWFLRRNTLRMLPGAVKIVVIMTMPLWINYAFAFLTASFSPRMTATAMPKQQTATSPQTGLQTTPTTGEQTPGDPQAQALEAELDELREQVQHHDEKRRAAETELAAAFAIQMLTPESVTFSGGDTYAVGDTVEWGPWQGRQISRIRWRSRSVLLSDGTILRMAAHR